MPVDLVEMLGLTIGPENNGDDAAGGLKPMRNEISGLRNKPVDLIESFGLKLPPMRGAKPSPLPEPTPGSRAKPSLLPEPKPGSGLDLDFKFDNAPNRLKQSGATGTWGQEPGIDRYFLNPIKAANQSIVQGIGGIAQSVGEAIGSRKTPAMVAREKYGLDIPKDLDYLAKPIKENIITKAGDYIASYGKDVSTIAMEEINKLAPKENASFAEKTAFKVLHNLGLNAPSFALSIVTGRPMYGLGVLGGVSYGTKYSEERERGATPEQAHTMASGEMASEVGTEYLPLSFLTKQGIGMFKRMVGHLTSELVGENINTLYSLAQDKSVYEPDKPFGDFLREDVIPNMADTTLVSGISSLVMGGGAGLILRDKTKTKGKGIVIPEEEFGTGLKLEDQKEIDRKQEIELGRQGAPVGEEGLYERQGIPLDEEPEYARQGLPAESFEETKKLVPPAPAAVPDTVSKPKPIPEIKRGEINASGDIQVYEEKEVNKTRQEPRKDSGKELWQLTRDEFFKYIDENPRALVPVGKRSGKELIDVVDKYGSKEGQRRMVVEQAIREGLPVPQEVLKDYPEFQPEPAREKKEVGVSRQTLANQMKQAGMADEEIEANIKLTIDAPAKVMGITPDEFIQKHGLEVRKSTARELMGKDVEYQPDLKPEIINKIEDSLAGDTYDESISAMALRRYGKAHNVSISPSSPKDQAWTTLRRLLIDNPKGYDILAGKTPLSDRQYLIKEGEAQYEKTEEIQRKEGKDISGRQVEKVGEESVSDYKKRYSSLTPIVVFGDYNGELIQLATTRDRKDDIISEFKLKGVKNINFRYGRLSLFQGKKGAIEFVGEGKTIIHLLENADKSTFAHEMFHLYVEKVMTDEQRKPLEVWIGKPKSEWTTEDSEKAAKSGEAYLREGKPPTSELALLFGKFKAWLREIYKTAKSLNIKLSKDVRIMWDEWFGGEIETDDVAEPFKPEKGFRRDASQLQPLEPEKGSELKEGIGKSDIEKFLSEKLDVVIRKGGVGGGALGIFKVKPEVIRTKFAHDIEVVSHEIGHALQKYLWGRISGRPFVDYESELIPIATKPRTGRAKSSEGFAEFIRLYITDNKKAENVAPNFYKYFDELLSEKSPEGREILLKAGDLYRRYLSQTPEQRKMSQISINENGQKKGASLREIITKFSDELEPLRKVVEDITQGSEISTMNDPYKLARLLPGVWGKSDAFIEYKPFNFNTYEFYGKSLKDILLQIPEDKIDLYRLYQVSKSEYESYENSLKEKRSFIYDPVSIRDAKYIIDKYDNEFLKIFKENVEYRDALLKYLKDSGLIGGDTYLRFKKLYQNYVPLYRVMDIQGGTKTGQGIQAYQPIKARKGSWRNFVDPIESDIKNTYLFISLAEKNAVNNALVDLANKKHGMGKYVEKIPFPLKKTIIKTEEILQQLSDDPLFSEIIKEFGSIKDSVSIFRKSAFAPKENVISAWKNGEQNLYQVHPDIARTIQALDREEINSLMSLASYPTRLLRAGAVLTPEYVIRNLSRDQIGTFIFSEYGYIPGYDFLRGILAMAKKSDSYWKFKISGAEHSMFVSLDRESLAKTVDNVLSGKPTYRDVFDASVKNPIEALRILSEIGEMGTRIGEFIRATKKEGHGKEGILTGGFAARDLMDFSKKGSLGKVINMIVGFWNAQVRGTLKMYDAHKRDFMAFPMPPKGHKIPLPSMIKSLGAITLPSVILAVINHDNEEIKQIHQWQKDLFWLIQLRPGGTIFRIPKPFELGIIYGSIPERIVNYIMDKDPRAFDDLLASVSRGVIPGVMPTAALPIIENWANKSWFLDRPIVPRSKEILLPQYQYQPYTTELAKKIGKLISEIPYAGNSWLASPAKLENIIQGWSGGLGMHITRTVDLALRRAGVLPDPIKPKPTLSDMPVIKAFVARYPSASTESIDDFYNNYIHLDKTIKSGKMLINEFNPEESNSLLKGAGVMPEQKKLLDSYYKSLNDLGNLVQSIYNSPKIPREDKRKLIDNTYLRMIEIAKNGNAYFEDIGGINK